MQFQLTKFEKKLTNFFYKLELNREIRSKLKNANEESILPRHILKRRIKIITNGEIVFDSDDYKNTDIPISIQYTIKQYGIPPKINSNNKTPIIYNITSNATSIFSSEEEQKICLDFLNKRNNN